MFFGVFPVILLFSEIKQFKSNEEAFALLNLGDTVPRLDKHQEFIQELQSEQLILAKVAKDLPPNELEGSGDEILVTGTKDVPGCLETANGTTCSNRGKCVDGKCLCDFLQFYLDNTTVFYRHSGRFCEECPYCRAQRCSRFLPCIECQLVQNNSNCVSYCQFGKYDIVDKVIRDVDRDEKFCDIENVNGCFFKFKYYYTSQNFAVVQYEKEFSCFSGYKIVMFTFWGVVIYVFALSLVMHRIYCAPRKNEVSKSRTSLSTRHDILRFIPRD